MRKNAPTDEAHMARGHHQCNLSLERLMPKVHAAIGHVGLGNVVALCECVCVFWVGRVCDETNPREASDGN